ncbi:MAG: flavodoxin domain-containing protein [Candidatus Thermoplasmatota archaeon]|nr:flavodoxin domain-containing protein [Candidatus Thermoplasmatota archaeon]
MNNRILVAYFTKSGASEEYANVISETLISKGHTIETQNLAIKIPDITDFETVILGTGVRMYRVYSRWKKVLKQKSIKDKHLYLFLSSGMAAEEPDKAVEKFLNPLVERFDLKDYSLVSFPGKMPERWAKYDDSEKMTTNPDLAKKWAEEISRKIKK